MNDIVRIAEHNGWRCLTDSGRSVRFEKCFDLPELTAAEAFIVASAMTPAEIRLWLDGEEKLALNFIKRRRGAPADPRAA